MREFLRGAVRLHVLHHTAQGKIHGAWMSEELARHGYDISPGTLYPTLHAMQREGLLESSHEVAAGRAVRCYEITEHGQEVLGEYRHALRELANEVLE